MLRDFVLELVAAPGSGATITLPGSAPSGRLTWAAAFGSSQQFVFYVLDNSLMQEWGVGQLVVGAPSTIIRPTVVLGNSSGTTARLNFTTTARCFSSLPALPMLSAVSNPIGRNLLHNGRFDVRQRGNGPWTAVGGTFGADRWYHGSAHSTGSFSDSFTAFSDASRVIIGDEQADRFLVSAVTGGSGAGDYDLLGQSIEGVRRLAGKTVTVSFWALATVGTPKVCLELTQQFGTGGSPSATTTGIGMTAFTLSTTWTRYTATIAIPSVSGKTLGTNGDDLTGVNLWMSAGATSNTARAGSIGVQAATWEFWGVQLELGYAPTPLEIRPQSVELALCQRFYQVGQIAQSAYAVAATPAYASQSFPVQMRAAPAMAITANNGGNTGALTWAALTPAGSGVALLGTVTGTGTYVLNANYTATADF